MLFSLLTHVIHVLTVFVNRRFRARAITNQPAFIDRFQWYLDRIPRKRMSARKLEAMSKNTVAHDIAVLPSVSHFNLDLLVSENRYLTSKVANPLHIRRVQE
jgi:hypothetical protein